MIWRIVVFLVSPLAFFVVTRIGAGVVLEEHPTGAPTIQYVYQDFLFAEKQKGHYAPRVYQGNVVPRATGPGLVVEMAGMIGYQVDGHGLDRRRHLAECDIGRTTGCRGR